MTEGAVRSSLIVLGIAFMCVFCLLPVVYMAVVSFSTRPDFLSEQVLFNFTWGNYNDVITDASLHFMD